MLKLRKFLLRIFSFVAIMSLSVSLISVPAFIRIVKHSLTDTGTQNQFLSSTRLAPEVILILIGLIFAVPPVLAFLYGMAWWKIKAGAASGRGWAIAASMAMLIQGIPLYVATYFTIRYAHRGAGGWRVFSLIDLVTLTIGIAGLVAFGPRTAMAVRVVPARPPRISGDGTSKLLDAAVWIVWIAAYWTGRSWLDRWGLANGLTLSRGMDVWVNLLAALLATTAMHEAGHASMAIAMGMRLRAFIVGPFQFRIQQGTWKFKFNLSQILASGGAVGAVPTDPNQPVSHEIAMIAAGPLASLLTGAVALTAALTAKGQFYEPYWQAIGIAGLLGLIAFVVNLVPMRPDAQYSDGAQIYQLLSGGPWRDYHRAKVIAGATLVTPLRPRDYDMQVIECASQAFSQGRDGLWLRLLATSHYLDCGDMPRARQANIEAESIYCLSAPDLTAGLYAVLTFDAAYLRHDAALARKWWNLMEAKKQKDSPIDYWLGKGALDWVEDRPGEAWRSLEKAEEIGRTLPDYGAYEFDRYRCVLLRKGLSTPRSYDASAQQIRVTEVSAD